ncbi:MAG: hypothetical protein GY804_08860 [Alphaproteobacteria bacterium]|nr:hypothetical protein [Alphaproteobacteria bacterium]
MSEKAVYIFNHLLVYSVKDESSTHDLIKKYDLYTLHGREYPFIIFCYNGSNRYRLLMHPGTVFDLVNYMETTFPNVIEVITQTCIDKKEENQVFDLLDFNYFSRIDNDIFDLVLENATNTRTRAVAIEMIRRREVNTLHRISNTVVQNSDVDPQPAKTLLESLIMLRNSLQDDPIK